MPRPVRPCPSSVRPSGALLAALLLLSACGGETALDYAEMEGGELQGRAEAGDAEAAEELARRSAEEAEIAAAEEEQALALADPEGAFRAALAAGDAARLAALADAGNAHALFHRAQPRTRSTDPAEQAAGRNDAERAAELGLPAAQLWLGRALTSGAAGYAVDYPAGLRWMEQAAEQGWAEAMFSVAQLYEEGPLADPLKARGWYRRAADAGVAAAEEALARLPPG